MERVLSNPIFVIFSSFAVTYLGCTVAYYWHKVRVAEIEANLKHEMLERCMSAEEIRLVIEASSRPGKKARRDGCAPAKTATQFVEVKS